MCMYVFMYVCVCMHVCMCICMYFCMCVFVRTYVYVSVIKEFDIGRTGSLDYAAFEKLYHSTVNVKAVSTITQSDARKNFFVAQIGDRFFNYSSNKQNINFAEIKQFLLDEQKVEYMNILVCTKDKCDILSGSSCL